jgi:hypothetical protein
MTSVLHKPTTLSAIELTPLRGKHALRLWAWQAGSIVTGGCAWPLVHRSLQ